MQKKNVSNFDLYISEIEEKINYCFKDKSLLRQAFTRTSFCNEHKGKGGARFESNEVLEFFGDSVLSTAIVTLLMQDFSERYEYGISTELKEGDFSNIRSKLSDKKNLSDATRVMGIEKYLQLGEGDVRLGIQNEPSVMEDLFESIIGAIYIDSEHDLKAVIKSVSRMLDVQKYFESGSATIQSYKNALQEWCADKKHRYPAPVYKTISESGPEHKKIYERACYIGEIIYGTGYGKNQKLADSAAAEAALKSLIDTEEKKKPSAPKKAPSEESVTKLREYAAKEKKASPEFRDLGESIRSTESKREYEIECRFAGISAVGVGESKKDAKIASAEKLLGMLDKKSATEKNTAKRNNGNGASIRAKSKKNAQGGSEKQDKSVQKAAPVQNSARNTSTRKKAPTVSERKSDKKPRQRKGFQKKKITEEKS